MDVNRRRFLELSAASAVALAGGSAIVAAIANAQAGEEGEEEERRAALTAKRWAMVIDLKKCREGKAGGCVKACNTTHNIPDWGNPKDEVKWIWEEAFDRVFPNQEHEFLAQPYKDMKVLTLCNHCAQPPCVRVCPTKATFLRADGIVDMDMHRCIGCRFCIAACPYGSRSFNWKDPRPKIAKIDTEFPMRTKGVVEKCNFCVERLAKGEMPACVETAQDDAMVFGDLDDPDSKVRRALSSNFTIRRKPELGTQPQVYYIV